MTPLPLGGGRRQLVLGTSHWGADIDRATAHALLDRFVARGGRIVETSPGWPVNDDPASYQAAVSFLGEWLAGNRNSGISAIVRVGAADNSGRSPPLLNPGFLLLSAEIWEGALCGALGCLAVDRDDREDPDAIAETVQAMRSLRATGLAIGLSAIRRPDLYAAAGPDLAAGWILLGAADEAAEVTLATYRPHFPLAPCLVSGLPPARMQQDCASLAGIAALPVIGGAIMCPGTPEALDALLATWSETTGGSGPARPARRGSARQTAPAP